MARSQEPPKPVPPGSDTARADSPSPEPPAGDNLWQRTADALGDLIAILDDRHRIVRANKAMAEAVGMTVADCIGKTCCACFHQTDDIPASCPHTKVLADGTRQDAEIHDEKFGGHLQVALSPLAGPDGKVVGSVLVARDINRRKRAEKALRKSERQYRRLFENAPVGIYRTTPDGRILSANRALLDILGFESLEELARRDLEAEGFSPETPRSRFKKAIERDGKVEGMESLWTRRDGTERLVRENAVGVRDEDGRVVGYEGMAEDITESVRARREAAQLRTIAHNANYGVAIADLNGLLTYTNPYFASVHGYEPREILGKSLDIFHTPNQRRRVTELNFKLQRTGSFSAEVVWHCHRDGRVFPMLMNGLLMRDDEGRPQFMATTAVDVTEREQAERAARVAHRMLLNARENERRRLARELHDSIGQELVAMKTALQAAGSDRADSRLAALGDQCVRLIREVRDICHGLYPATLESLGLAAALRQLEQSCGSAVDFSVTCDPALAKPCLAAQQRIALYRIAQEAVSNAMRHSQASQITISLGWKDQSVQMVVTDNGRGFDVGGLEVRGLGLRTMEDRARAIGGAARVVSDARGTRVEVRAPLEDPGPVAPQTPADVGHETPADAWSSGLWDW